MVQGELFNESANAQREQSASSFFGQYQFTIGLDRIILISIGCVVLFVLTYSFGYEKGHRIAEERTQELTAHIETLTKSTEEVKTVSDTSLNQPGLVTDGHSEVSGTIAEVSPLAPEEIQAASTPLIPSLGKYTIQVATANTKERAEKEVLKLSTIGHKSFFVRRGKFYEVCIGAFDTVANAKPILNDFKSKSSYSDAFVRPIPQAA